MEREALLSLARKAANNAHCPYSHFHVGAVVVAGGKIFAGANIEISSFGLTLCAERSALAAAISAGAGPVTHIAIVCVDAPVEAPLQHRMPCGACRQWMADLAPDAVIYVDQVKPTFRVTDLLPFAFLL